MTLQDKTLQGSVDTHIAANGLATITFFHPSHNSLPGRILAELAGQVTAAGQNDQVKVIVLKSGGDRTFCAGASFDELSTIEDFPTGKRFFMGFANVINACRTCPKLIIGRVQGKAVGGGVGVAAATDYCIATKYAAVKLSELAVGIGAFCSRPCCRAQDRHFCHVPIGDQRHRMAVCPVGKRQGTIHRSARNSGGDGRCHLSADR